MRFGPVDGPVTAAVTGKQREAVDRETVGMKQRRLLDKMNRCRHRQISAARDSDMAYEEAQLLCIRANLAQTLQGKSGKEDLKTAAQILEGLGIS